MTWREVWGRGGYGGGGSKLACGQTLLACVNSLSVSSPPLGEDSESATLQAEERKFKSNFPIRTSRSPTVVHIMQLFLDYNEHAHLKLLQVSRLHTVLELEGQSKLDENTAPAENSPLLCL